MAKVALRDDGCGCLPPPGRVVAGLDDDCPCTVAGSGGEIPVDPPPDGMWAFEILLRERTGYDEDGTPQYDWVPLTRAAALLFEEREEYDAEAGLTLVKALLKIRYTGPRVVTETAMAVRDDGVKYRVVRVDQFPDRLEFQMRRIDQQTTGELT